MRISDWSSDVCSSDLKKKELALPAQPKESWHGSPPSKKNAKEKLENAKSMAQDGTEDGSMQPVKAARQLMADPVQGGARTLSKPKREEARHRYAGTRPGNLRRQRHLPHSRPHRRTAQPPYP